MPDSQEHIAKIRKELGLFFQKVKERYGLVISAYDYQYLEKSNYDQSKINGICRKYELATEFLAKYDSSNVRQTIKELLNRPVQSSIPVFSRLSALFDVYQAGWLNQEQFNKLHFHIINNVTAYNAFHNLKHEIEEENLPRHSFSEYLDSGLFEQGVYTLYKSTNDQLQELCQKIKDKVQSQYQLPFSEKDEDFVLNNRMRNEHVIHQIVIPKYREAHHIQTILGQDYLTDQIHHLLHLPFNEGLPILKRITALAQWTDQGYLSILLTQFYHESYLHDMDALEDLFVFLEMLSEQISQQRAIHYLEMGLYQTFNKEFFEDFLQMEHIFYDAQDHLRDSITEYVNILKTSGNNKLLITNARLSSCFFKFRKCVQSLNENIEIPHIQRFEKKLSQYLTEFTAYYDRYYSKNLSLPTQKPYGAINLISSFIKIYTSIENESLLKNSIFLAKQFQKILAKDYTKSDYKEMFMKRYQERLRYVQIAVQSPANSPKAIAKLIPLDSSPSYTLAKFLKKK